MLILVAGCAGDAPREEAFDAEEVLDVGLDHRGGSDQFAGGFAPESAPHGGFGGGDCTADRVPVVFVHGNGDEAKNWDYPPSTGAVGVRAFVAAGYDECELFGINWLSPAERGAPQFNYHRPEKAAMLGEFIHEVLAYTGQGQVDVVSHSLGVILSLHAIEFGGLEPLVRRFIGIAGGMRGLTACYSVGYANPLATVCGSQNFFDSDVFGFYPHGAFAGNPRMGDVGFRDRPAQSNTRFYTLRAGVHDQVLCAGSGFVSGCDDTALFDPHNTGQIQVQMLTTECTGAGCCSGYDGPCR